MEEREELDWNSFITYTRSRAVAGVQIALIIEGVRFEASA
jgi:hypothetical protein